MTEILITNLRRHFCNYVLAWKASGKLELFIDIDHDRAVFASNIFVPVGSSYATAVVPLIEAWKAPITPTPEEGVEDEIFALQASEGRLLPHAGWRFGVKGESFRGALLGAAGAWKMKKSSARSRLSHSAASMSRAR
jgi:hypothetical protein